MSVIRWGVTLIHSRLTGPATRPTCKLRTHQVYLYMEKRQREAMKPTQNAAWKVLMSPRYPVPVAGRAESK